VLRIAADEGLVVREGDLVRTDLYLADEAFFTGTAAEVVPIREVDDRVLGEPGPVTRRIQEIFTAATRGREPRYTDWLEPVA
jgi:branched-chain amino acid aminotransferase